MDYTHVTIAALIGVAAYPIFSFIWRRAVMAYKVEVEDRIGFDGVGSPSRSWWWRVKSRNGQIVATSETYDSAGNARKMARQYAKASGHKYIDHTKDGE